MELRRKIIPCHLIAGALGVGKTTAIRNFIAKSSQYTAVLVNDFGQTGYDASFIAEADVLKKPRVENVPGGCICCSSAAQLLPALKMLCEDSRIQRIIIEPSGIVLLNPLLKMLHDAATECGFRLAPIIVMFDPARTRIISIDRIPYWRHLVECAEIAVLSRCDLAPQQEVQELRQYLEQWRPSKLRVVQTVNGEIPESIFNLSGKAALPDDKHLIHINLPAAGTFRSKKLFIMDDLKKLLEELAPNLYRFKGVFWTEIGFFRLEIAGGKIFKSNTSRRIESSADWVGGGDEIISRLKSLEQSGIVAN